MPKLSANISTLYPEMGFLQRFSAAAQDGFDAVEFQFAYEYTAAELVAAAKAASVKVVLLNCPAGDVEAGERGTAVFEERIETCRQGIDKGIAYARALDCKNIHLMAGILADENRQVAEATFKDNLRYAADRFDRSDEVVLVEALNTIDTPGYFVSNLAQAADIIDSTGYANVRLQFDFYHCQMTQGRLAETFDLYLRLIEHIQVAGVPGRHELDCGEVNYDFLFNHIDASRYPGYVGCEYHPLVTTSKGLGSLKPWLSSRAK